MPLRRVGERALVDVLVEGEAHLEQQAPLDHAGRDVGGAHRTEEDGVEAAQLVEHLVGQDRAVPEVAGPAEVELGGVELDARGPDDLQGLGHDLGADAVASDHCHLVGHRLRAPQSTATSSTLSVAPVGVSYSTLAPAVQPSRACPSGEPGDMTSRSSCCSSIEPSRYLSVVSSPSYLIVTTDARGHGAAALVLDDLGLSKELGEVADAALHLPLLLLGGVVVAVLGEVAELAGGLDLAGDLDPTTRGQVDVLGLQPVERRLGEVHRVGHPDQASDGAVPARRRIRARTSVTARTGRSGDGRRREWNMRMPSRVRRFAVLIVLAVVTVGSGLATGGAPAGAAGMTTHAWMGVTAIDLVQNPQLKALLKANRTQVWAGAQFPDSGYVPGQTTARRPTGSASPTPMLDDHPRRRAAAT